MGSAVSNLVGGAMGGGGGGLLGAIGGIAGSVFGGPIGGMIGSAIGNALQDAIGGGLKDGLKELQQEHGMPKFVAEAVSNMIDQKLGALKQPVDANVQQAVNSQHGEAFGDFRKEIAKDIVAEILKLVKGGNDGGDEDGKPAKAGKGGGTSWMQAIAKAMGQAIGQKASRMVELSQKIQDKTTAAAGEVGNDPKARKAQQDAAAEAQKLNTEFQATGQEFNLLQTTFSTAIKTLGEGMSSIARKQ